MSVVDEIEIAVYAAGGFGKELAWLAACCSIDGLRTRPVCFLDDSPALIGQTVNDLPVLDLETARKCFPTSKVTLGVGSPLLRQALFERSMQTGYDFATLIHPNVEMSKYIDIGDGTVICGGNILTVNINIGSQVQINLGCTIGHDVVMGDFTTLAPGVHVSGWVHFGQRVYVGTGAVFINGTSKHPLVVGDDAVVGAGACVTKSVPSATTVVGVPAKSF